MSRYTHSGRSHISHYTKTVRRIETEAVVLTAHIENTGGIKSYHITVEENGEFGALLERYREENRWSGNRRYTEMVNKYISGKPFNRTV